MANGTVKVSFAGTAEEAKAYAAEHEGVNFSERLRYAGDDGGLPMLSAPFKNIDEMNAKVKLLTELGWAPEFQTITKHA